jgi:hypothetical protein
VTVTTGDGVGPCGLDTCWGEECPHCEALAAAYARGWEEGRKEELVLLAAVTLAAAIVDNPLTIIPERMQGLVEELRSLGEGLTDEEPA